MSRPEPVESVEVRIRREIPVRHSFRTDAIRGKFDLPYAERAEFSITLRIPDLNALEWKIGIITGPSGSGKTIAAQELFGCVVDPIQTYWGDGPIVDEMPADASLDDIISAFYAVGLSSIPAWIKPFGVLSTGERYRAGLARLLLRKETPILVVDEYTSVVDRTVARAISVSLSRFFRRPEENRRIVLVSCHRDIIPWIAPDWVLDMSRGEFFFTRFQEDARALGCVSIPEAWKRGGCFADITI